MKKIQPNEKDFSKWFRNNYQGWVERVEPALGVNPGFPDLLCLTPTGLLPVELKIGTVEDGVLWTSEIRPAQIAWHRNFADAGAESIFVVGVWQGEWKAFVFDGTKAPQWHLEGFRIGVDAFPLSDSREGLETALAGFITDWYGV